MLDLLITVALIQSVDIYTQPSSIVPVVVDTIDSFTFRSQIAIFVGGKMEATFSKMRFIIFTLTC